MVSRIRLVALPKYVVQDNQLVLDTKRVRFIANLRPLNSLAIKHDRAPDIKALERTSGNATTQDPRWYVFVRSSFAGASLVEPLFGGASAHPSIPFHTRNLQ